MVCSLNFIGIVGSLVRSYFSCSLSDEDEKKMVRSGVLPPSESGEFIAKNAKYVQIHEDGLDKLCKEVRNFILPASFFASFLSSAPF